MANPQHITELSSGAASWNKWRGEHPTVKPDLEGIAIDPSSNLSGFNLSNANCRYVNFGDCNLTAAKLSQASLQGADLSAVNGFLIPSQFAGADLAGAKLPASVTAALSGLETARAIS